MTGRDDCEEREYIDHVAGQVGRLLDEGLIAIAGDS